MTSFGVEYFKLSPEMLCIIDISGHFLEVNPSWESTLGLKRNEILNITFTDLVHSDDIQSTKNEILKFSQVASYVTCGFENRLKHKNGSYRWLAWSAFKSPESEKIYCTVRDITHFKREKSLYELIIENGNHGTWDWDLETNHVYFNERFCSMIGLDVKKVKHDLQTWDELTHPEDKIVAYRDIEEHLKGNTAHYRNIHRMKHADGHWVWILDQGKVVEYRDGKPIRFAGTHTDITYIKELEAERGMLTDRFKLILAAIKFGVWDWDLLNNTVVWDDNMYEIYGVKKNEFVDILNAWAKILHPDDKETILNELQASLNNGADFDSVFRIILPTGEIRHIAAKAYVERDKKGFGTRVTGINWDITKKVEEMNEKRIQEEVIKDQQARMMSSAKLSSLGEMASGIAHEINNPLAIIKGKASQILKRLENGEVCANYLVKEISKIEQNSERIVKIIKGLKTISRPGESDPFQIVCFKSVLDDVLELCSERFKYSGVLLKTSGDLEASLRCQETQFAQVLLNLINNAHDAVSGVNDSWVHVHIDKCQAMVKISVTDSGSGISEEVAEKIMQPFFTTKEVGYGTGLGLSISKSIVEAHGGKLYLDRNCLNTCFIVELPIVLEN